MPLLCDEDTKTKGQAGPHEDFFTASPHPKPLRKQSQHSVIAKTAILNQRGSAMSEDGRTPEHAERSEGAVMPGRIANAALKTAHPPPRQFNSLGAALTDTPATTAPNSPRM